MKKLLISCVLMIGVLASDTAFAWNKTGHMIIALIAYRDLDAAQRQQLAEILTHHPHYQQFLTDRLPQGVTKEEWSFIRAASWPDWVRPAYPGEAAKPPSITKYHQSPWHYIDDYFVPPKEQKSFNATTLPTRDAPNIITAFEDQFKKLSAKDTSPEDGAIALCWVEHLIGDCHQPLHSTSLASSQFPRGDKGGNDFTIAVNGKAMKLHAFWDDIMGTEDNYKVIDLITRRIEADPFNAIAQYPEARETDFTKWIAESHEYASEFAYLNGYLKGVQWHGGKDYAGPITEVPIPPVSYIIDTRQFAEHRIALAGFRLSEKLKEALAAP